MQEPADKKNSDAPSSPAKEAPTELPMDTRLLSETVIELNISRKNVGIYPPGRVLLRAMYRPSRSFRSFLRSGPR